MDWDIDSGFCFEFVEKFCYFGDGLIVACVSRSEDNKDAWVNWNEGDHTNCVFIAVFSDFGDIKAIFGFLADRNDTRFDFKVTSEFSIHQY